MARSLSEFQIPRLHATRRGVFAALGASVVMPWSGASSVSAAPSTADGIEVGAPEPGRVAFSLFGKIEQRGDDFIAYGYLTSVADLDSADLFDTTTPTARNESAARLTFHATATRTAHFVIERVFVVHASGEFLVFAGDTGGASFDSPDSFIRGDAIATASLDLEGVVVEQATASGVATQTAELALTDVQPFVLAGESYQFGHDDLLVRCSLTGKGTLVAASKEGHPELPHGEIVTAGSAVVIR